MITTGAVVSIVIAAASLFLVIRSWQAQRVSFENGTAMAVGWAVIIAIVAFIATRFGLA